MLRSTVWNVAASVFFVAVAGVVVLWVVLSRDHHSHPRAVASTTSAPATRSTTTIAGVPPPSLTDTGLASLTGSSTDATGTATDSASGTVSTSVSASGTAAAVTQIAARQTVVAYLNDVNAGDRASAQSLVCQALLPSWLQNIDTANSDFNYVVTNARFTGGETTTDHTGWVLHYTLTFSDSTDNAVDFTVIAQNGPKICGETRG